MNKVYENVYKWQDNRDASTKYNGFLFQDLVGLDVLLDSKDKDMLIMEWIEDIMIISEKQTQIYQVKHYPSDNTISINNIKRDFFFQFLLFKLENQDFLQNEMCFKIYYVGKITKNEKKMIIHVENQHEDVSIIKIKLINLWQEIKANKKEVSKKSIEDFLFTQMADEKEVEEFEALLFSINSEEDNEWVVKKNNIKDYRIEIRDKLYNQIINYDTNKSNIGDANKIKEVLISGAIYYIQKKYTEKDFHSRKINTYDFKTYLIDLYRTFKNENTVEHLSLVILGYIDDLFAEYDDEYEEVTEDVVGFYKHLYSSTKRFFDDFVKTKRNRYRLLNTISRKRMEYSDYSQYEKISMNEELKIIYERNSDLYSYIRNIWKVLFDIAQSNNKLTDNSLEFDTYIDISECNYIKFSFDREKDILILPSANFDNQKDSLQHIFTRTCKWNEKPRGWYFRSKYRGNKVYVQDIANFDIKDITNSKVPLDITRIDTDSGFYIKCMKCIKVDDAMCAYDNKHCINYSKCREEENDE